MWLLSKGFQDWMVVFVEVEARRLPLGDRAASYAASECPGWVKNARRLKSRQERPPLATTIPPAANPIRTARRETLVGGGSLGTSTSASVPSVSLTGVIGCSDGTGSTVVTSLPNCCCA